MYNIPMPTFREYLLSKIQELEKEKGGRITLDEFADYLGVKRPILSMWMSGKNKPSLKSIQKLAEKLGNEIYDVFEIPNRNPYLQRIYNVFDELPIDRQKQLAEEAEQYTVNNGLQKVSTKRKIQHN